MTLAFVVLWLVRPGVVGAEPLLVAQSSDGTCAGKVTLEGSGFAAETDMQVWFVEGQQAAPVGQVRTDAQGAFSMVPAAQGPLNFICTHRGAYHVELLPRPPGFIAPDILQQPRAEFGGDWVPRPPGTGHGVLARARGVEGSALALGMLAMVCVLGARWAVGRPAERVRCTLDGGAGAGARDRGG